ncbi:MAG: diacylglycerol kinase family lipid kinase [Opitutaceae bacterium]|jgi:YegS/Rv2252/BmrU family lipid kinase|nr:diacylglycerol kinase family lipid kinase [Opitutaceae bacterium]
MKIRLILNPKSGRSRRGDVAARVRAFIGKNNLDARLVATRGPGDATVLAREAVAEGCGLVAAIGGDGTVNEVAAALVNTPVVLGIVPRGSGDGLVRHLGIPRETGAALENLLTGGTRVIDSGTADGAPFFNVMGAGFDAVVSHAFARGGRRGLAGYAGAVLGNLRGHRGAAVRVEVDGAEVLEEKEAFIVSVANSAQYGNGAVIAPGAEVDDGRLDLVIVRRAPWWRLLGAGLRLMTGRLAASRDVVFRTGGRFVIGLVGQQETRIHLDGEARMAGGRVEVAVLPRSLRVRVPRGEANTLSKVSMIAPRKRKPSPQSF